MTRQGKVRTVFVRYGEKDISVDVPEKNLLGIFLPNAVDKKDPDDVLKNALDNPADGLLPDAYQGNSNFALIVVNDATRPTPTARMLDHLLPCLDGCRIEVLVATGTHRPATDEELRKILGTHYGRLAHVTRSHICDKNDDLVYAGKTARGTELFFNHAAFEFEKIFVLGSVEPHYYAGWTGGRKGLMPGLAGRSSIEGNHRFALHPQAGPMRLNGNPCHEDLEEAVRALKPDGVYALNVVLDRDKDIYSAAAGGIRASFDAAVKDAGNVFAVNVPETADIVISVATPPLDNDLYQMQKVIEHGRLALKKGGILIAVSRCHDGLGPSHYLRHLAAAERPEDVLPLATGAYSLGDHKAVKIAEVKLLGDIWAVTGLPPEQLRQAFMEPYDDLQNALNDALDRIGDDAKIVILPSGSLTVPVVETA